MFRILLFLTLVCICAVGAGSAQEKTKTQGPPVPGWRVPGASDIKGYWKESTWDDECKRSEIANRRAANDAVETYEGRPASAPSSATSETDCWKPTFPVLVAAGDFDGDGAEDEAKILISTTKRNVIGIFAFMGAKLARSRVIKVEEMFATLPDSPIQDHFVATVKPGETFRTACGKGYFDCGPNDPSEIRLRRPGILFGEFESWEAIAYWDSRSSQFKVVQLSD